MSLGRRLPPETGGLALLARLGRGSVLVPGRHEGVREQGHPPPEEDSGQFLRPGGERMPAFSFVQAATEEVGGSTFHAHNCSSASLLRDGDENDTFGVADRLDMI